MAIVYHEFESRAEAEEHADMLGVDLDAISRNHDSGTWSFVSEEPDDDESVEHDAQPGTALVPFSGSSLVTLDGKAEEQGSEPQREVVSVSHPDAVWMRIASPMLRGQAQLELQKLANRLGEAMEIVNAAGEVLAHVTPKAKRASSGEGRDRDERGLTAKQAIILDLVRREDGATNAELMKAGASDGKSISWEYQMACITYATQGQYKKDRPTLRWVVENGREKDVKAFRMMEVPEADRARVWYENDVAMFNKKQIKKVRVQKPVVPANSDQQMADAAD